MASESRLLFMILPPAEIREALSAAFERTGLMSELGDALFAPTNWHQSVSDRYADIAANRERLRDAGAAVRAAPFLMSFERLGSRGKTAGVDLHWEFQSRRKKVDGLIQLIDTLNARLAEQQMDAGGGHTPHITVSWPFCAPAWPPETGASTNCRPRVRAARYSSRATSADAVVWSTKMAPGSMPANAPSAPSVTARRSSSLPTQQKTMSAPRAASRGVAACAWFWPPAPAYSAHQAIDLVAVRLYTVTWCPARARWPAMGEPITPRPRKATLRAGVGS